MNFVDLPVWKVKNLINEKHRQILDLPEDELLKFRDLFVFDSDHFLDAVDQKGYVPVDTLNYLSSALRYDIRRLLTMRLASNVQKY